MKMYIIKESMNCFRAVLKDTIKSNSKSIEVLRANRKSVDDRRFLMIYATAPHATIEDMNRLNGLSLPSGASLRELKNAIDEKIRKKESVNEKLKSVLSAAGKDGFTKVTYGLPAVPLLWKDTSVVIPFLIASGIKLNAEKKNIDDSRMDELEQKLWEYEKQMAVYIDEDFTIKREYTIPFLKLFDEYLKLYLFEEDIYAKSWDIETLTHNVISMGYYIIFCNTSYFLDEHEFDGFAALCEFYKTSWLVDFYEAVSLACDYTFYELEKIEKRRVEKKQEIKQANPIEEYVRDGRVIASSDMNVFREMLDASSLSNKVKSEYIRQMEEYIEFEAHERAKQELVNLRCEIMSPQEMELYNLARCYVDMKKTVENIDAAVLMLKGATDEYDREDLKEEIGVLMETVRRYFSQVMSLEEENSIVYYTGTFEDKDGIDVRLPKMLWTILSTKLLSHVQVNMLFRDILNGNTARDRKVKANELPCLVFSKGREVKIFYTKVKETTVIIDLGFEEDGYQGIIDTVQSDEFKKFLVGVRDYVNAGNKPVAKNYTDLIKTALNRKDKVMKLI